jgi:hypothetical protein
MTTFSLCNRASFAIALQSSFAPPPPEKLERCTRFDFLGLGSSFRKFGTTPAKRWRLPLSIRGIPVSLETQSRTVHNMAGRWIHLPPPSSALHHAPTIMQWCRHDGSYSVSLMLVLVAFLFRLRLGKSVHVDLFACVSDPAQAGQCSTRCERDWTCESSSGGSRCERDWTCESSSGGSCSELG